MLGKLGISTSFLPEFVQPGTRLGGLLPHLVDTTRLNSAIVFATAGHDTASAVAAVPAESADNWCDISSGTWPLMGVETPSPVIHARSLELNFTNEVGAGGHIRLLKNIAGLWLLQECRRAWIAEGHEYSYAELAQMAPGAGPARSIIDVDAFLHPGHRTEQIAAWCRPHSCAAPQTVGPIDVIHIVGGGSKNMLLNRLWWPR